MESLNDNGQKENIDETKQQEDNQQNILEENKNENQQDKQTITNEQLKELINQFASQNKMSDGKYNELQQQFMQYQQKHAFWDTQPVPKFIMQEEEKFKDGPLQDQNVEDIQKNAYNLPEGFEWSIINLKNDEQAYEVYILLRENYVEDKEHCFRFDYPVEFLRWALLVPHYQQNWHIGIRVTKTKKLYAFLSGIPVSVNIKDQEIKMAEINFLCVHKKLRSKRLAPVLIKEITRRINLTNTWQAIYTAGVVIPKPICTAVYWHRSLNIKKLVEAGFSQLPPKTPLARFIKMNKLPQEQNLVGNVRAMEGKDIKQVTEILNGYLSQFQIRLNFTEKDVKHFFLPRENVIYSYVVEDFNNKQQISNLISFYSLPSTILKEASGHSTINVAYAYYMIPSQQNDAKSLFTFAIIEAKRLQFDVFNALDIMNQQNILEDLKFGIGDGYLHYYFYNWIMVSDDGQRRSVPSKDIGIVLV